MTARKKTEPVEGVEVETTDEPTTEQAPTGEVAPIVGDAPVSAAAMHNARYADVD